MPKCMILQYSTEHAELLRSKRQILLDVDVRDMEWVTGLEYVALIHGNMPQLVGKITELVFPSGFSGKAVIEFGEARNPIENWGSLGIAEAYSSARLGAHRVGISVHDFPDTDFYTLGEPYELKPVLDGVGAVNLKSAVTLLAETYGVDESQVKITISN
jgi:hypothetical protein